ncbi:hypothetical protein Moror_13351, partial [Moniliophthora roreri MCA 2997]
MTSRSLRPTRPSNEAVQPVPAVEHGACLFELFGSFTGGRYWKGPGSQVQECPKAEAESNLPWSTLSISSLDSTPILRILRNIVSLICAPVNRFTC